MKAIERIKQVIESKGLSNSTFEQAANLSNGYISKQLKRNADLGEGIMNKILDNCPEISAEWLLTGRGEMLKSENENADNGVIIHKGTRKTKDRILDFAQEVPLYDMEATAGLKELLRHVKTAQMLDTIKIPNIPLCDGAITITGDSMYPLLKSGDIIMYKEIPVELQSIFFGEMYLLGVRIDETEEMITVKYVQKSDISEEYVKLVSQNQHHQPKEVRLADVTAMAMVKVSIRKNTMF
ncbi:S24 family peptidase [Ornithobacterium rhinotracheale]|uniref:S24 family peptidase n=1 Tax=Ornithobacterium rhinotracheale TaxID=28251 RepID=UPI004036EB7B